MFCCFNNTYKITPAMFAIWMRLLRRTPGAVLWLFEANSRVAANLQHAMRVGIARPRTARSSPRRSIPTGTSARMRLADLFLDTLPVNAHTTASEALWAGLPVLTCAGEAFAGRVAGSLLHAMGLPDLVTDTLDHLRGPGTRPWRATRRDWPASGSGSRQPAHLAAVRYRPHYPGISKPR